MCSCQGRVCLEKLQWLLKAAQMWFITYVWAFRTLTCMCQFLRSWIITYNLFEECLDLNVFLSLSDDECTRSKTESTVCSVSIIQQQVDCESFLCAQPWHYAWSVMGRNPTKGTFTLTDHTNTLVNRITPVALGVMQLGEGVTSEAFAYIRFMIHCIDSHCRCQVF